MNGPIILTKEPEIFILSSLSILKPGGLGVVL